MVRKAFDRTSFVAGLIFMTLGFMFLADRLGWWTMRTAYLLPLLLIGLGIAVLLGDRRLLIRIDKKDE